MIRINSPFGKTVSTLCTFTLVFCMVPSMAWASTYQSASTWVKQRLPKDVKLAPSKVLSAKSMQKMQGKANENPYASGQRKYDVVYRGVNMMSGEYTISGTDLTFEGGYGIPVNVTRSYSANNGEEGPFGKGWSLSADVRTTAGGLAKGGSAPVRTIPNNFKERPSGQLSDPNAVIGEGSNVQPVQAVLASDASGQEETIQRDADGILTTPPWDKNKIESEYETIVDSGTGTNYQVMKTNTVKTPEGTTYVYEKQGSYPSGVKPYDNSSATAEPSNVLKIKTATDRHGNVTTYTYGGGTVSFNKTNGTTTEHPLTKVHMPNGHEITFNWGSGATANRVTSVTDGVRTVNYTYSSGLLTSVTTPGGKTTTYGYGSAAQGSQPSSAVLGDVITSITDPRGLTEGIVYTQNYIVGYGYHGTVSRLNHANGHVTTFDYLTGTVSGVPSELRSYAFTYYDSSHMSNSVDNIVNSLGVEMPYGGSTITVRIYRPQDIPVASNMAFKFSEMNYDPDTMNLVSEKTYLNDSDRFGGFAAYTPRSVISTTSTYNFMGAPLSKTTTEYDTYTASTTRTTSVGYAYWGAEKYYQQKATKDQAGRYSYTDYFDNAATTGKKGQTYKVYDTARTTFYEDTAIGIPSSSPAFDSGKYWKYRLTPVSDTYSAKFDYDSKGRVIDIWKLQSTTTTPWTYVRTHSTYGADNDGSWGQANQVVEDYGGINRTTNKLEYDASGRATKVEDATGNVFYTTFDSDGVVQSIDRIVSGTSVPILTYTYGTSGLTNGQVLSQVDNLSGVSQSMAYVTSGAGKGNLASISETNGLDTYSCTYSYNVYGDKEIATYTTQVALGLPDTVKWKYWNFLPVGNPTDGNRSFQNLASINVSTSSLTSEEFQYSIDPNGRLRAATFAMTPQSWTPSSGATYYDASHPAAARGRSYYAYDPGGRTTGVYHWWDTWNSGSSSYTSTPIRANECVYELSGSNRGLKTQNKFYNISSGSWNLQRTESYGYDSNLDYLTSANYGDGLANATPSWTYDAAGNRASDSTISGSWTYDNLNRMTASPGYTYINTIGGNRLERTGSSAWNMRHSWDVLNRMTQSYVNGSNDVVSMTYRADGLRVTKANAVPGNNANKFTHYRYDDQMGIEDVEVTSGGTYNSVTRYARGARGIDAVSRTVSGGTTLSYPLYDVHGNNVGLLAKSGSSWSISDERAYDAWGQIRSGGTTGDQRGRYVANLGHKQDDESGLIYMRARFYEPASGRFISEDSANHGTNWFSYCSNDPVNKIDTDGNFDIWSFIVGAFLMSPLGKAIARTVIGKMAQMTVLRLGQYLMGLGQNLIRMGNIEFIAGVEVLRYAGGAGGSIGQTTAWGWQGAKSCVSGAAKFAFGVMIFYIGAVMANLGADLESKVSMGPFDLL